MAVVNTENDVKLFVFIYIDDKKQPQYLFHYETFFSDLNNVDINYFKTTYGIEWRTTVVREQLEKTFIIGEITKKDDNTYNVKLTDTIYTSNDGGVLKCELKSEITEILVEESFIQQLSPLFRYAENDLIVKNYNCKLLIQKYPEQSQIFVNLCEKMKEIMPTLMFNLLNNRMIDYDKLKLPNISSSEIQKIKKYMDAFIKLNETKITTQDIDNIFQNMYNSFLSRRDIQNTNQPVDLKNEVESKEETENKDTNEEETVNEDTNEEEKVNEEEAENKVVNPLPETTQLDNKNNTIEEIISGILNNINKDYEFNYLSNIVHRYCMDTSNHLPPSFMNDSTIPDNYKRFIEKICINNKYFIENTQNILSNNIPEGIKEALKKYFCKPPYSKKCDTHIREKFLEKMVKYQHNIQFIDLINSINANDEHKNWSTDAIQQYIEFWINDEKNNNNQIIAGSIVRISYNVESDIKEPHLVFIGIVKSVDNKTHTYTISMYKTDETQISFFGIFKIMFEGNNIFKMIKNTSIIIYTIDLIIQQKDLTYSLKSNKECEKDNSSKSIREKEIKNQTLNTPRESRIINVEQKPSEQNVPYKAHVKKSNTVVTGRSKNWN